MDKILDEREICDLECLSLNIFYPLQTFMTKSQYDSCLSTMRIDNQLFPIPVTCSITKEVNVGTIIRLLSKTGIFHAELTVSEIWPILLEKECESVFGVYDTNHPYIDYMTSKSDKFYVSGSIRFQPYLYHHTFLDFRKKPDEIKLIKGPVIGFQTRNPLHCSHIDLMLKAAKSVPESTILLHPVEGVTQDCDIPFTIRMKCYKEILHHLPNSLLSILTLNMRMAGPKEAVWHALIRKNYGCTHFIVGRDHAGPSYLTKDGKSFFEPLAAQQLAKSLEDEMGIQIIGSSDINTSSISGTELRNMLLHKLPIPTWYSYPEVVHILQQFYERPRGVCYYFIGLSGSGKSTMAEILKSHLEEKYPNKEITLLDADIVRTHLSKGLVFSREDRSLNVRRIGYVASEIVKHGGIVIVSNIAPFSEDRLYNKKLISKYGDYVQFFLNTPLSECENRDSKGLYKMARNGIIKNFTGISDPFEIPLEIENCFSLEYCDLTTMKNNMISYINM
jgi:sulfate adenylyltransferase